jgi:hypothetical protein
LQRVLDEIASRRAAVISLCARGKISEDDLDFQLTAITFEEASNRRAITDALDELSIQTDGQAALEITLQNIERLRNWVPASQPEPAHPRHFELPEEFEANAELADEYVQLYTNTPSPEVLAYRRQAILTLVDKILVIRGQDPQIILKIGASPTNEFPRIARSLPKDWCARR